MTEDDTLADETTAEQKREEQIAQILKRIEEKVRRDLVLGPQPYDEIERQAQEIGEELKQTIEEEVSRSCGMGYQGSRLRCRCGHMAKYKGRRSRILLSLSGSRSLTRAYYYCASCQSGWCPLDKVLELREGQGTIRVRALVARFCSYLPFRLAGEELEAICGIRLAPSTIEHYAQAVGENIQKHWQQQEEALRRGEARASGLRPQKLHIAMDGVIIYVGGEWREAKLGCAYERSTSGGVGHVNYYATLATSASFGKRLKTLAHKSGADRCSHIGVVSDGAPWIWQETGKYFPQSVQILDYFHAAEHLWAVAHARFGHETEGASSWMKEQKARLLCNQVIDVIRATQEWSAVTLADRDLKRKTVDYLSIHAHRMQYETFEREGWHIGSGVVEAGCKCVVKSRMGGAGMRWGDKGAEAILNLTAEWRSSGTTDFRPYV
jgi:hypothetical protein